MTKNKVLQKQKSQTINAESLEFLFFEDIVFALVRFNLPLLEKKVEIASAYLFESFWPQVAPKQTALFRDSSKSLAYSWRV